MTEGDLACMHAITNILHSLSIDIIAATLFIIMNWKIIIMPNKIELIKVNCILLYNEKIVITLSKNSMTISDCEHHILTQ